jgi:hypothetical protein
MEICSARGVGQGRSRPSRRRPVAVGYCCQASGGKPLEPGRARRHAGDERLLRTRTCDDVRSGTRRLNVMPEAQCAESAAFEYWIGPTPDAATITSPLRCYLDSPGGAYNP